ncbi:MAG: tRNA lysidine(34) synthetase TilS [Candidatus Sumerlaeaceae bacterium]
MRLAWQDIVDVELLRCYVNPDDKVLAAVSGGPDSTALLLACAEARTQLRFSLECCYVDHGVRPGAADREAGFVRGLCERFGIPFHLGKLPPLERAPNLGSFEGKLRQLRYEMFRHLAAGIGATWIALGHTADDLVETFLMHLLRGMALGGAHFEAVQKVQQLSILRPLWRTWRADIYEFLQQRTIVPLSDETNRELRMTRNKVRHLLLPLLEQEFNRNIRRSLFATALALTEAREVLSHYASEVKKAAQDAARLLPGAFSIRVLLGHPRLIRQEALALWLEDLFGQRVLRAVSDYRSAEALLDQPSGNLVILRDAVAIVRADDELVACQLPMQEVGGRKVLREVVAATLAKSYAEKHPELPCARIDEPILLKLLGEDKKSVWISSPFPTLAGRIVSVLVKAPKEMGDEIGPLKLRNRQPGDRPNETSSLKEILIQEHVPFFLRDYLVVVADKRNRPVAVVGLPRISQKLIRLAKLPVELSLNVLTAPGGE